MPHKEVRTRITLRTVFTELRKLKGDIIEHMDKKFAEHEEYFTCIQQDLLELKTDVRVLKTEMSTVKQELKEFRAETKSFHSGFGAKSGRQDTFNFLLTGMLEAKNILTQQQASELRTV